RPYHEMALQWRELPRKAQGLAMLWRLLHHSGMGYARHDMTSCPGRKTWVGWWPGARNAGPRDTGCGNRAWEQAVMIGSQALFWRVGAGRVGGPRATGQRPRCALGRVVFPMALLPSALAGIACVAGWRARRRTQGDRHTIEDRRPGALYHHQAFHRPHIAVG